MCVVLPWKRPPVSERLRVVAQLVLPDGRVFEADRDVTIRPPVHPPRPEPPLPPIEPPPPDEMPGPHPEGPSLSRLRPAELGKPRPGLDTP